MPSFADSFWSADYASGLRVLFTKLEQGTAENRQILTIARMRAEAEELYSAKLGDIAVTAEKINGGFSSDDGATMRKAYEGVRNNMEDGARTHKRMAQSIRDLVVVPFSRWCDAHDSRVRECQDELQGRVKAHDAQVETVKKLRSNYFNKCRLVEDLEEENKLAFQDPETSPKTQIPEIKVIENKEIKEAVEEAVYEIGDDVYHTEQLRKILSHALTHLKLGETKVPILGTYPNTTCGSDIVEYMHTHMNTTSVSQAERIGQDLVSNGILRLVGNVGNTFANSSKLFYQWRSKAFEIAGVPEKKLPFIRAFSLPTSGSDDGNSSPVVGAVSEYLSGWNVLNNAHPGETPGDKMRREARESDEKYKAGVRRLDELRCDLEEAIMAYLKFLERCELDRLKALKTVLLDLSGAMGNVIPALQSTIDNMMLFQETIQPSNDLRYLLENYRTGSFIPRVVVYENYYNKVGDQIFGIDLEARARADKKRVPLIITTILTYLDLHYPDLEGDEARRGVWLADVPLVNTHKLRNKLNNEGKGISPEVFADYDIPTVASLLRLYLLELPDSLISSHVYEIIRTVYNTPTAEGTEIARIPVLQQTLSQLRLTNIATLDACMNHFTRLIDLTSADETYIAALAASLAPCILRPRVETSLTMEERHSYRLVRDLFAYKDAIFSELKRMATQNNSASSASALRPRAISTNESNRKALVEERNRLLMEKASGSRSRATSPAPGPRGSHRRDRSVGGPETRFPIASPTASNERHRSSLGSLTAKRQSLEVPVAGSPTQKQQSAVAAGATSLSGKDTTSSSTATTSSVASPPGSAGSVSASTVGSNAGSEYGAPQPQRHAELMESPLQKRNSLGRSSAARFSSSSVAGAPRRLTLTSQGGGVAAAIAAFKDKEMAASGSVPSTPVEATTRAARGVTLEDKPMEM
ncbi:Rho-GTPase-activating protein 8 [Ceratocystis platani]|uniref:Rho-GTPase-activating protein 8 n=1 Tax=Ceratocystis fimbriata f. sp. platani TaxID=88771 RepID=A0A0F8BR28_CERFI|nr:Rho-GTPase-activating protein 8 [Ceratocystis platani]